MIWASGWATTSPGALAVECTAVVLLGTDSPNVPLDFVHQAFAALEQNDVALGPTPDGGFYLIGLRGNQNAVPQNVVPGIFDDVAWSTPNVWRQTVANIRRLNLRLAELPNWYDVDDLSDLTRLQRDLIHVDDPSLIRLREKLQEQTFGL